MILEHATWFLFAWVFCNQAGVPVPVVPALLGAGALAGSGHLSVAVVIGIAVGASLVADLTWYECLHFDPSRSACVRHPCRSISARRSVPA